MDPAEAPTLGERDEGSARALLRRVLEGGERLRAQRLLEELSRTPPALRPALEVLLSAAGLEVGGIAAGRPVAPDGWERLAQVLADGERQSGLGTGARRIGSVRLEEVLGSGGMGTVWRGYDEKLERAVAVKTVHAEHLGQADARSRFRREARLLSQLNHPAICHVYDLIETPEADYLVLELVEGHTLRSELARGLIPEVALRVGRDVAEALAAAHERRIIHRDLKPENVMLDGLGRVKVLDFGIARPAEDVGAEAEELPALAGVSGGGPTRITRQGWLVGTLAYMSPEQAAGAPVGEASDCFSLGLLLQELLTGSGAYPPLPFVQLRDRVIAGATEPLLGVPAAAAQLVQALLARDPAHRPSALEAARRLRDLASLPARLRRLVVRGLVGAALVALLGVSAWQWRQLHGPRATAGSLAPTRVLVLPFETAAGEEFLGQGLSAEVADRLRGLQGLRVVNAGPPGMAGRRDAAQVAADVSADVVVTGRAVREGSAGEGVTVEAAATRVKDRRAIWKGRYEHAAGGLAALEGVLAGELAAALGVVVPEEQAAAFGVVPTTSVEAYHAYLRARSYQFILTHSTDRFDVPIRLLERAVALDPGFALAQAELSNLHSSTYQQGIDRTAARAALARTHAQRALALAPHLAEVRLAQGNVAYRIDHDLEGALASFSAVAEGVPSSTEARRAVAFVLRRLGRVQEGLVALREGLALSPREPVLALEVAHTLFLLRRHEEAQRYYERSIALAPDQTSAYLFAAWNLWDRGRLAEARAVLDRIPDPGQPFALYFAYLQHLYERDWDRAVAVLARVREPSMDWQLWAYPVPLLRGFALEAAGRLPEARAEYAQARARSEGRLREQPADPRHHAALALALAGLGRAAEAEASARRAVALYPPAQDALFAPFYRKELCWTLARTGQAEAAERELAAVLALPGWITRAEIALDPRWQPVGGKDRH